MIHKNSLSKISKKIHKTIAISRKNGYNNIANKTKTLRVGVFPLLSFEKEKKLTNTESKVEKLIAPKIEFLGYELYDVEYVKEGKEYYLRVYIEGENGIH